jgi:LmbE family N-acetylglucosaminyl deacetylase
VDPAQLGRISGKLMVVSPHLDDAVLSCADVLTRNPGSVVVTVFAGTPSDTQRLTHWDSLSGFRSAGEAMRLRREEDQLALFLLESEPLWLDFLDAQYGISPSPDRVAGALSAAIGEQSPAAVLLPLGLFHDDHRLASEASLALVGRFPRLRWIAYADALYRSMAHPCEQRLRQLRARGWLLQPLRGPQPSTAKRHAVSCYGSQLRALATPGHIAIDAAFEREWYWQLRRSA